MRLLLGQVTLNCETPLNHFGKMKANFHILKKKCLLNLSPPITSNKLQTIVNINSNKFSFKCHLFNEKNTPPLIKLKLMVSFQILTKYINHMIELTCVAQT